MKVASYISFIDWIIWLKRKSSFKENHGIILANKAGCPIGGATISARTVLAGFAGSSTRKPIKVPPCYWTPGLMWILSARTLTVFVFLSDFQTCFWLLQNIPVNYLPILIFQNSSLIILLCGSINKLLQLHVHSNLWSKGLLLPTMC